MEGSTIRSKEDVEFHSDFGRDSRPAVNVKVNNAYGWATDETLIRKVLADNSAETDAPDFLRYMEEHAEDERLGMAAWEAACESAWEMLQNDGREVFGRGVKVWQEGRSGGWAVVDGLPDFDSWDAMDLNRWRTFARYARNLADDVPYLMVDFAYFNAYLPSVEWSRVGC